MGDTDTEPATGEETTTEPLGDAGEKALKAERQARRDAESKLRGSATKIDDLESQLAAAETAIQAVAGERDDLTTEVTRLKVAIDHGITADHLDLLVGSDEAELSEKAKKVAALTAAGMKPGPVVPSQGVTPTEAASSPEREFLRELLGKD